ncbi:hypothetical protein [Blastococcus montanus]|uniref:hypothetical protein n=1 Tax=Blastococcus montanus TaxID=3144973 RepID=UPI003209FB0C
MLAPYTGTPGRGRRVVRLPATRVQLRALQLVLGPRSPSEEAARWRLRLGPEPAWARRAD